MSMLLMVKAMQTKVGNPLRKLVLIKLADNANDKGECWPSYQHIADQCEMSKTSVRNHIKKLGEAGLLMVEHREGPKGNSSNLYHLTLHPIAGDGTGIAGDDTAPIAGDGTRTSHSFESVKEPVKPPTKKFQKPSVAEVYDQMVEKSFPYKQEAENFVNFYESKGWLVGKSKMKNWKSAVSNWVNRSNLPKKQAPVYHQVDQQQQRDELSQMFRSMGGDK